MKTGSQYEELRVKIGESTVTLYTSGKLVIMGDDAEEVKEILIGKLGLKGETLLGIDETGRGENFGPFVVAAVLGNTIKMLGFRDSKKTRDIESMEKAVLEAAEEHLVLEKGPAEIDLLRGKGKTMNAIEAEMIDEIAQNFRKKGFKGRILVDGKPLNAGIKGVEFKVKADDLNPVVGAASILAKAARQKSKDNTKRKSWKNY